ncbi:MAG: hypothetical protein V4717_13265 [Bacteroidota bacterium]
MKNQMYRLAALLFVAFFSTISLTAQSRWNKDDNRDNDRRNDKYGRRYDDERDDSRRDYDSRYDRRNDNNNRRDYSGYTVRQRPSEPRYVQSRRPSRDHVWIEGDWMYSRGRYNYQPGYWITRDRAQGYVPGRWERERGGWYWIPGYFTRQNNRW